MGIAPSSISGDLPNAMEEHCSRFCQSPFKIDVAVLRAVLLPLQAQDVGLLKVQPMVVPLLPWRSADSRGLLFTLQRDKRMYAGASHRNMITCKCIPSNI